MNDNMKKLLGKLKPFLYFILVLTVVGLGSGLVFTYLKVEKLDKAITNLSKDSSSQQLVIPSQEAEMPSSTSACGSDCKKEIDKRVSAAIATLSGSTKETVIEKQTVVTQVTGGSDFIPMGTTFSTTSTDWVDVPDSTVYLDLTNDYSEDASVSWEASLKVAHANGKAFARLYDGTHNIAVDYSEISSENNATYERVTTRDLPFWRGHNLYKVQIKSLNSFEVTYSGGKMKVQY